MSSAVLTFLYRVGQIKIVRKSEVLSMAVSVGQKYCKPMGVAMGWSCHSHVMPNPQP